ncbi:hypothetical protein CBL_10013 [Carabus blaptoides fortunei]
MSSIRTPAFITPSDFTIIPFEFYVIDILTDEGIPRFAEAKVQIITGLKSQEVVSALLAKRHDDRDEFGRVLKTTSEPQSKPKNTSQGKEVATTNGCGLCRKISAATGVRNEHCLVYVLWVKHL